MTNTTRLQIPELAASENVANGPTRINEGWTKIDNIDIGYEDFLQAGVIVSTDWLFTANIVGGTGALGSTANVGGTAWLPDPVIGGSLMRSVTTPATLSGLVPATKPAAGKYMTIGIELTAATWGTAASVSVVSGAEKATEAEAIAAPPVTTSGRVRIRDVVIKNTTGVYSIVLQRDRRPWAKGAFCSQSVIYLMSHTTTSTTPVALDSTHLSSRIECSGAPLRIRLWCEVENSVAGSAIVIVLGIDGVASEVLGIGAGQQATTGLNHEIAMPALDVVITEPIVGSHLYQPYWYVATGGTGTIRGAPVFTVEEILRPNVNNGTS